MKILTFLQTVIFILLLLVPSLADEFIKNPVILEKLTLATGITILAVLIKLAKSASPTGETAQKSINS
ncbi:hypothetical protein [Leeuwenhoekiella parthenopeia]|uniref:Holin n=1 Tax=Leeuwenhoekiella parthenopeia TaxID=2890320 RepID=A0ABS8GU18_9FLAO|nr:hypothetical protein [Leeuwenhoekiella parthenopeia]MCC4212048.1 hypothetical protein [Leeuwenhoekiella parthenopeia]